MRLTFAAVGVAVLLVCVMIDDIATSVDEESDGGGGGGLFSADDPLDDSSADGGNVAERNREREGGSPEVDLGDDGALEATKRGQATREGPWVKGHRPNRRAFSPWGGKRYFNPWGGKRFKSIYLERKANSIFDKRPGFQPWGGKRSTPMEEEFGSAPADKRAFSPWGGKREAEAASRDQINGLRVRQRRNANKNLLFAKP